MDAGLRRHDERGAVIVAAAFSHLTHRHCHEQSTPSPMTALLADTDGWLLALSLACVLGAAVVRGFSGFGFSLLSITSLSLVMEPAEIVPSIFMLEIAASLPLLPGIWRDVHWRSIGWL